MFVYPLQAQSTFAGLEPFYINYSTDDGLPSSECHHTIQDQRGYIWIATDNGVSRFDGYQFRNFSADEGLKNNVVFYLQEDNNGQVWMLTMSGNLYYYDYATDRIHGYEHNDKIEQYKGKHLGAGPFYVDSLATIYIGLRDVGILKIKKNGDEFLYEPTEKAATIVLEVEDFCMYTRVNCRLSDLEACKLLYFDQKRYSPWEFHDAAGLRKKVFCNQKAFDQGYLVNSRIKGGGNFVKKLRNGKILGHLGHLVYLFNEELDGVQQNVDLRIPNEKSIIELENGEMLLGASNSLGIYSFDGLEDLENTQYNLRFLKGKKVSDIRVDGHGGLWVTTLKHGMYYIPSYLKSKIIDSRIGLLSDDISSISVLNQEELLIGQGRNAIYRLNLKDQSLTKLPDYRGIGQIRKIYTDKLSDITWVASGNLCWLENGRWNNIQIGGQKAGLLLVDAGKSFNLSLDKKHLWSWNSSLLKINLQRKEIEYNSEKNNLKGAFHAVFEDFSGNVWVGNLNGFFKFKDTLMIPQTAHPAFQTRIEDIRQMQDSTLVIGTKGAGVIFWKGDKIIQLTRKEGLTSNMIENVYVDSVQRVWAGTSEGLNMIRFDKNRLPFIKQYTRKHGLPSNEINQVEVVGKNIWVATTKGLVKLPQWAVDTISKPPILEKIWVNGISLTGFDYQNVTLNPSQNSVQIEFLTIDFDQHGEINYRYKLAPNQTEWVYTQSRRLDFSALNDNRYHLEVQSQNRDGFWSDSTVFEFVILPPFWESWWFILSVFLIISAILYQWILRIKREANLVRKMAEAEQFALRSQMNPHFIFNCLASIQGFILTGDKDKAIRYLARFSKLIRTALKFMDKEKIRLEEEVAMLTNYLELEKMRHGNKFNYEIEVAEDLDLESTEILPLMIQPFVENSIIHAFVDKKEGGLLTVQYYRKNENFLVTIEDNGIGLKASQQRKKQQVSHHHSMGTKIIARRLALEKNVRGCGLVMLEVTNEEGGVVGTRVTLDFGKLI